MRLAAATFEEAEAARARGATVLVPIGATEAHGPHLPLGTDCVIAEELADRVAARLDAVVAPAIAYAVTDFAAGFAGTVSIDAEAAEGYLAAICAALARAGWARICLVNAHLEPGHVASLRRAAARAAAAGARVIFPDVLERRHARTLSEEFKRGACHAGRYETSLVMAARGGAGAVREAVRTALAPNPVDLARAIRAGVTRFEAAGAPRAYFGDPAAASAEHGEELYARLVEIVLGELAPAV